MKWTPLKKKGYAWVTLFLFMISFALHWMFGWKAYKNEQAEKNLAPQVSEYLVEVSRDTFENWQSEFLQLLWQVAGLSFLFYVGSPSSKEGDERKEAKLDLILKKIYAQNEGEEIIEKLNKKFPKE